jgi:pilus assembly protein TadC
MKEDFKEFVKKSFLLSLFLSFAVNILVFFILLKEEITLLLLFPIFIGLFLIFFMIMMQLPGMNVKKRKWEVETDILYSGRFLLLQLESGKPLINALAEVSKTKARSAKYYGEIVLDIDMGTPVEEAIENAVKYSPSKQFKTLLEQINKTLKTGADVKVALQTILDEITKTRIIEIKEYGKKLGPAAMFYMIVCTIVPSIGTSLLVIVLSFLNVKISFPLLIGGAMFLFIMQYFFILLFKAIRPITVL